VAKKREIMAVDCETDPFKYKRIPEPFIWGAYNGEDYWRFDETRDLAEFLRERDCIAYAHNGGKFDWHFILPFLDTLKPITVINGRISRANLGRCELRDSYNLIPVALKKLQSDSGGKLDIEYWKLEKEHREEHGQEIAAYLKQDCVVLWKNINRFIDEYGLHLTQASAAMKIWEDMSGETERTDADYFERYSRFYYGGRTECFKKGIIKKPFEVYDIKSAYPHAMATEKHPKGRPHLAEWDGKDGSALVTVRAKSRGIFPYRQESGALCFPNDGGERIFSVTGWELKLYEEHFGKCEVLECYRFTFLYDFSPYVARFYKLKAKAEEMGDASGRHFAKIFLNSLYGKYASNPDNYAEFQLVDLSAGELPPPSYTIGDLHAEGLAMASRPLSEDKARYYNVATAASVTGFVRAKLARVILKSKEPLYCDTDSLACVKFRGDEKGKELGQWESEGQFTCAAIGGKKLYTFEGKSGEFKIASKGAKLSVKEIFSIASGLKVEYKNEAPTFSVKSEKVRFVKRNIKAT
jgi:hypothetical protein